jgi:hypothetical protein
MSILSIADIADIFLLGLSGGQLDNSLQFAAQMWRFGGSRGLTPPCRDAIPALYVRVAAPSGAAAVMTGTADSITVGA